MTCDDGKVTQCANGTYKSFFKLYFLSLSGPKIEKKIFLKIFDKKEL